MTLSERMREPPCRYASETEDQAKIRRQRDRIEAADALDAQAAALEENERLRKHAAAMRDWISDSPEITGDGPALVAAFDAAWKGEPR